MDGANAPPGAAAALPMSGVYGDQEEPADSDYAEDSDVGDDPDYAPDEGLLPSGRRARATAEESS